MKQGLAWVDVCTVDEIPRQGARVVETRQGPIAVFRTVDDRFFALDDRCPHKGGPLSQGIVHGHAVTCPLHNWVIDLASGEARGPDEGCSRSIAVDIVSGRVRLGLAEARARVAAHG
jgi:nitrite reductase [NAD(P)H] small subunit